MNNNINNTSINSITKQIKSVIIDKKCKSFDRKKLTCYHIVNISYDDKTTHNIILSAEDIKNFYSDYITEDLKNHLFFVYDRLLFDDEYFINLDETHINKYFTSCCIIS